MVETEIQGLTCEHREHIQRQYLSARFRGADPLITDTSIESDGRKRKRMVKEAVNAGLLISTAVTTPNGSRYRINDVIGSVAPTKVMLFELWTALHEKNPSRDAYTRPWLRVEDQSIDVQCALLSSVEVDWFVVSPMPYEYHSSFADTAETITTDRSQARSFHQYWAGPFPTLDDAITRRRSISGSTIAVSSAELRLQVAEYFAERKLQRTFANNLLWGLVDVALVPKDLLFDTNGKPIVDTQLEQGHSLQFMTNPNLPANRGEVNWESNLAKSIERLKSRIASAQQQLDVLRIIESSVTSCGGWDLFMDALERRLRVAATSDNQDKAASV